MQNILETVTGEWGWAGINPKRIIDTNKFGNLIIEGVDGLVWRIMPEGLSCEIIAKDIEEFEQIRVGEEFILDWNMESLVEAAEAAYGPLPEGSVFNLVIPAPLGGAYNIANINVLPLTEAIAVAGSVAYQIKDLPDGEAIQQRR